MGRTSAMTILFSLTLFLSACLLFFIQPMVGKMLLPTLGGSFSVWNTCMVFFQALLLLGYLYSHVSTKLLGAARQSALHIAVLFLPLLTLPIAISPELARTVPADSDPTIWLLGVLFLTAGLPFFVVSTSAPIFQKWFSETDHPDAKDPYFLYAASNAGSIAGLLLYPLFIERIASVPEQATIWQTAYLVFVALTTCCAVVMWRSRKKLVAFSQHMGAQATALASSMGAPNQGRPVDTRRRLWWILLAFIPSSLMLGVTTYITTDIASVPLLWVIPLGLFLLSFILVYAARPIYAPWWVGRGMCLVAVVLIIAFIVEVTHPPALLLGLHLLLFFAAAMVAHTRLAKDRPTTSHLTEYYLWISVGGVLGGVFNALLAPLIFTHIYEYILVIALACAVRETRGEEAKFRSFEMPLAAYIGVAATVSVIISISQRFDLASEPSLAILAFGIPALIACTQISKPPIFAGALVVLTISGSFFDGYHQRPLYFERNFYGSLRVADDFDGNYRQLIDGNTVHGRQRLDDEGCLPLSYYYPTGPAGQAFADYHRRTAHAAGSAQIAIIGMGIGSLACYGRPHEHWDLFEINPLVIDVATDPRYFDILERAPTGSQTIISGDGRLRIADTPKERYDIIVIDAFSSGSIPVHLMTREAIELYLSRLTADGVLLFHISNRIFDLAPILANIVEDLEITGYVVTDDYLSPAEEVGGKDPSVWAVIGQTESAMEYLARSTNPNVQRLEGDGRPPWTDAYSDIITPLLDGLRRR